MVLNPILKFFRDLEAFNHDPDFIRYRESNIRRIFTLVSVVGIVALILFHLVDLLLDKPMAGQLLRIRLIAAAVLLVNLLLHLSTRYQYRRKIFASIGFYIGIAASAFIAHYASQSETRYWSSAAILLITWFAFIPFRFSRQVVHGFFFLVLYSGVLFLMGGKSLNLLQLAGTNLLLLGFFGLGVFVAFSKNQAAAAVFSSRKAARVSDDRYRILTEYMQDVVWTLDMRTLKFSFVSPSVERLRGFTAEEVMRMPFEKSFTPQSAIKVNKMLSDVIREFKEGKEITSFAVGELEQYRRDGSTVWIEVAATLIADDKGELAEMLGVSRDITNRKAAEMALRESETKFREITDLLPQLIYELDEKGFITFLNRTGKEMFGITEAAIRQGLHAETLVVPEQRERMRHNFSAVMNLNYNDLQNEYLGLRSDGSVFPILIYGSAILRDGKVCGNRGIVIDITDRINAEEELRRVNERLTLHFRETPLAYIEWNEKLEVTDWNPSAEHIFGYSREDVIGKHAFNLIVPEHIQNEIVRLSQSILNQTGGQRNTNENITKSGQTIICNWYNTPLKDTSGKVIGLASLVQDITEQKKLEAELEKYVTVLERNYSESKIKVQTYSVELETRKNELLQLQKENLQSQFETLRSQVNPHFLFNSLNVLTSLIKIEPELAEQFTIQLSMVYRYVLENKEKDLVSLETELDFLKAYTFLLDIRFSGKMKVVINLTDDKLQLKVVPLALQLLIENAIKHNTFSRKQPLQVDVFSEADYLVVKNNLQLRESYVQSTGVGLENIASRYAFFTDRKTVSGVEGDSFVVKVPLL